MAETRLSKRRRELKERLRAKMLKRLEQVTQVLYREGAEFVYVFGTVLIEGAFNEHSDADIAVKGIAESKRASVMSMIEHVAEGLPIDVIFLEDDIRPEIRDRIMKEGVLWKH